MELFDFLIVGSGPSGIGAARRLKGSKTCIVDVGRDATSAFPYPSLQEGLAAGDARELLGQNWEMLANVATADRLHPKLRSAQLRHVLSGDAYSVLGEGGQPLINSRGSHAAGGMANAWGSQLFRYTQADLDDAGDWPISVDMLDRYYADLEDHIGLSGEAGDLTEFLGRGHAPFQPPIPMVPAAKYLFDRYRRSKRGVNRGLSLAHPQLSVLTRPHRGRPAYHFGGTDFFSSNHGGIYSPKQSLSELKADGLQYFSESRVVGFRENADHVEVDIDNSERGTRHTLRCRHLLLGCGTLQSSRLVLQCKNGHGRALPFVDHSPTIFPLFIPALFGRRMAEQSFNVQLIGRVESGAAGDLVSFYYPGGLLWSDILPDIPLPFDSALDALKVLSSGMLVAQVWQPSRPTAENRLRLDPNGRVLIDFPNRPAYPRLPGLISDLRRIGGYSLKRLASMTAPTWGFHHVATLPMRANPGPFETHVDGRLWDSRRVRVIDGSVLPSLPAKNHSLTLMANAARIADEVKICGY